MNRRILACTRFLVAACMSNCAISADIASHITTAVASVGRPPEDMARDTHRKPADTLTFAGVRPGDKILELIPAGGYYTRILSHAVGAQGRIYALQFTSPPARGAAPRGGGAPGAISPLDAVYRLSRSTEFSNVMPLLAVTAAASGTIGLPEQVDVIWTSDNYHDFHNPGSGLDMSAIDKSIFRNLKPGGVFLVIDHASAAGSGFTQTESLQRSDSESVKREVLAAGFEFDGESKVLANPDDDHSRPARELNGTADEFMLRFRKPKTAPKDSRLPYSEMKAYYGNTLVLGTAEQRNRTIFYQPDRTYQEFGADGITNGIYYIDAYDNICMYHQSERAGMEGTVACRQMDFPASKHPRPGDSFSAAQTRMMSVALVSGRVYPNVNAPMPPDRGQPAPPATAP